MKTWWKITAVIDGVLLLISLAFMAWLNNRPAHGLAALTGAGWFAVWYILFQTALVAALLLAVCALIVYMRKRHK